MTVRPWRGTSVLLLTLTLTLACGSADDVDPTPSGSTDTARPVPDAPVLTADSDHGVSRASRLPGDSARARVVFLGTSLTAGFGLLRDSDRFTDRLQRMADSAGIPAEMVNAGVSGDTSAGGLRRLDWVLARPVDVLVVELGANDGLRGTSVESMKDNLRQILRHARERQPDIAILLVAMEAPPNLGSRYTTAFRRVFPDLAHEEDGVTPGPFLLEGVAGHPGLNQEDGIHPNALGHQIIARTLWPSLEPLLRQATRVAGPE